MFKIIYLVIQYLFVVLCMKKKQPYIPLVSRVGKTESKRRGTYVRKTAKSKGIKYGYLVARMNKKGFKIAQTSFTTKMNGVVSAFTDQEFEFIENILKNLS